MEPDEYVQGHRRIPKEAWIPGCQAINEYVDFLETYIASLERRLDRQPREDDASNAVRDSL